MQSILEDESIMRAYSCGNSCGSNQCGPVPFKVNFAAEALGEGMIEELYKALANGGEIEIGICLTMPKPNTCGEDRIYAYGTGDGLGKAN